MTIHEIKSEAKSRGVKWVEVAAVYRELRAMEDCERLYDREIRETVWRRYAYSPDCIEFWRHGMQVRFPRAFGDGDRTLIPDFDVVADGLKYSFPQFDCDDPAEAVFEYLQRDYVRQRPAADVYREALEAVTCGATDVAAVADETIPF